MLDPRTGSVLATIPLGDNPSAMAVDERTGHAIVVSAGARPVPGMVRLLAIGR